MKPKVYITREIPKRGLEKIKMFYDVEVWSEYTPPPKEIIMQKAKNADALVTLLTDPIDKEILEEAKRLKIISQYAVGIDNIDIETATRLGIYVTNTPGVLANAVADLTWALILGITRRIVETDKFVRTGSWEFSGAGWHPTMMLGMELRGKKLGIIGLGSIGTEVAKKARCFGMQVIYYSKRRKRELEDKYGFKYVDLETLLKESDVISIHVPLTKETELMIGEKELRLMKKTAYLINTSRGRVIDEDALLRALKDGWIAGAALDVFWEEPLPKSHPLINLDNVILTSHVGSATVETRERMAEMVADNLIAFYKGEIPPNLVNKDVIKISKPGF